MCLLYNGYLDVACLFHNGYSDVTCLSASCIMFS